jgi:hypothetical protein
MLRFASASVSFLPHDRFSSPTFTVRTFSFIRIHARGWFRVSASSVHWILALVSLESDLLGLLLFESLIYMLPRHGHRGREQVLVELERAAIVVRILHQAPCSR